MPVSVSARPDEVLAKAEQTFVSSGYNVETRTPNSLTVYTKPEFEWTYGCLSILLGGFPFIGYLLILALVKYRVTVTAVPEGGGTAVAVSGLEDSESWAGQWAAGLGFSPARRAGVGRGSLPGASLRVGGSGRLTEIGAS